MPKLIAKIVEVLLPMAVCVNATAHTVRPKLLSFEVQQGSGRYLHDIFMTNLEYFQQDGLVMN